MEVLRMIGGTNKLPLTIRHFYKENKEFKTQETQFWAGSYILKEFGWMDGKRGHRVLVKYENME